MADISLPSMKDVEAFTGLITDHPGEAIAAFVLLAGVAILIGVTSKLPTGWAFTIALPILLLLVAAGGFAIYRIMPSQELDTAVVFKFKLADETIRVESTALNTYVGAVDGTTNQRRMLFRVKDEPGKWAAIRTARICPPSEADACPQSEYTLPVWLIRSGIAQHFRDDGPGARIVVVFQADPSRNCTIFPEPRPSAKPKNYGGPDLCKPEENHAENQTRPGFWWMATAWADERSTPADLVVVRKKLASIDPKIRAEGRVELQKASNAAELLDKILGEPAGKERDRIVANALIAAIYFGDDRWKDVTAATKARIMALLTDRDDLVSRYAKSVLRRYPEVGILADVKAAAASATGEEKAKLVIAASDIEYNLGVTRLQEARADRNDAAKWQTVQDTFQQGIQSARSLPDGGKQDPDVTKNYFGLALSTADKWSTTRPSTMAPPQVTAAFSEFLEVVDRKSYPFAEQIEAATCVTRIGTSAEAQYEKSLGECLKFFR